MKSPHNTFKPEEKYSSDFDRMSGGDIVQILELLLGESKYVEYKRDYTKTLLKTVSAFAIYHDGHILIGAPDDGTVVNLDSGEDVSIERL